MDWDVIGAIGEIVSAIAVIGTLIYLARQIGHSVGAASASQNRSLQESYEKINELILANPPLLSALKELSENPTGFSPYFVGTLRMYPSAHDFEISSPICDQL